jgi:hypothetical protein
VAKKGTTSGVKKQIKTQNELVNNKIALDELIPVVSLLDYTLSLMQSGNSGKGKYVFKSFGEKKEILYQDILVIIEEYRHFLESGFFIIADDRVINRHGLQEITKNVLTRDNIDKILSGSSEAVAIYKSCSDAQKKTIIGMVTRKLATDPMSIDMNVVYELSRESGIKIQENADDSRLLFTKEKVDSN